MRNYFIIILSVISFSCNSPLNKSIFEDLNTEELKNIIHDDTTFLEIYKYVRFVNDSLLKTEIDRLEWYDLTYKRLQKYVKFSNDTSYFNPINKKYSRDWNKKFEKYLEKIDSVLRYWRVYKEKNSLSQYVKIELVEINKEYYSYHNDVRNINLGFKLTPLKGEIDQMRFSYVINAKIDNDSIRNIFSFLDKSKCIMSSPFSKSTIRYWKVSYLNKGHC